MGAESGEVVVMGWLWKVGVWEMMEQCDCECTFIV